MFESFLYYVGVYAIILYICWNFYSPLLILFSYVKDFLMPWTKKSLIEKYGNWAVITGSSDGIGKDWARQLAQKGFNIVLMARNEEKLKNVQKEIVNESKVEVKYIVVDFTEGFHIYDRIEKELADISIGILVNNVGINGDPPATISQHSRKMLWDIIQVNCAAALLMTNIVLPGIKRRGKGAIINISSIADQVPLINHAAIYSISKMFLSNYTKCLQMELIGLKNIDIILMIPCFVKTNMIDFAPNIVEHPITIKSDDWVKSAISLIGRTHFTNGHIIHSCLNLMFSMLPEYFVTTFIYWYAKKLVDKKK